MDAIVKEEKDGIDVSIDVKKEVKVEEDAEYQHLIPYEFEPKIKLIDETDVKIEIEDDYQDDNKLPSCADEKKEVEEEGDGYQHIIPYEYRDYMEHSIGEEQKQCSQQPTAQKLGDLCQKCHKYFVVKSFGHAQGHAVTHSNLKRFKCELCSYQSWIRANVQQHINSQHKNESCSMKEIQLSLEDRLELRNLTRECFPEMTENTKRTLTIDGKRYNVNGSLSEEEPSRRERKLTEQCQKCNKLIAVSCFAHAKNHAVTHTNLKKFKCEKCSYGSWHRFTVQTHINSQHKNESCSMKKVQLSEEEHLELIKFTKECFPGMAERIPSVYQDYSMQDARSPEQVANKSSAQCQKCYKFVVLGSHSEALVHAATHTSLKRFKCGQCNYGSWRRFCILQHFNIQHKNESLSVKRIQLSAEEQLELKRIAEECFPGVTDALKRKSNEKSVKVEEEHSIISRKRQRTSDAD